MNPTTIQKFVTQARRCAMEMLITGSYIQRELPRGEMPETLRDSASQACTQLIATPPRDFPTPRRYKLDHRSDKRFVSSEKNHSSPPSLNSQRSAVRNLGQQEI